MNTYKVLQTDMEYLAAALIQVQVSVWYVLDDREHIIDYGGPVVEYNPLSIKIMGSRYFRNLYDFRVQKN